MKVWYLSKMFWANIITLAIGLVGVFVASEFFDANHKVIIFASTILLPALNVVLRWLTTTKLVSRKTIKNLKK